MERISLYLLHTLSEGYYINLPLCIVAIVALFYHSNLSSLHFFPFTFKTNNDKRQKIKMKIEERNNNVVSVGVINDESSSKSSLKKRSRKNIKTRIDDEVVEDEIITFHHNENSNENSGKDDQDKISNTTSTLQKKIFPGDIICLLTCWITYVIIWHGVLSNIPLSSPMPYGVHAR